MAKILLTHGVPMERFSRLQPNEILHPEYGKTFSRAELLELLPECDAAVAGGTFDRELLACGKKLKLVVCYGAGFDSIDLAAATELGIPVANAPDSVTEPTAELAMALILAVTRRVAELDRSLRAAPPEESFGMGKAMGVSLEGMTLGIVGMGRIGSRVADFGRFLNMRIVYSGHDIKPESVAGNARFLPLEELLRVSDVVSLHCPFTPENQDLLSAERLALLKPTAFVVNTARGKLIDEEALTTMLEQRRIAGAALDVFAQEPHISDRLRSLPNVVLTPHIGSNTLYTRNRMAEDCCDRILDALHGVRPKNLLNAEVWPRRL